MITITRDEANEEMQEIQTEATVRMFRDTQIVQKNVTTQQTSEYYIRLETFSALII